MTSGAHNDGGAAFPQLSEDLALHPVTDVYGRDVSSGMSLRDWFAGQALAGLLAHASGEAPDIAPNLAYKLADAMLATRAAQGDRS